MAEFLEGPDNVMAAPPGVGLRLMDDVWTHGDSGYAAMGKEVPMYRRSAAVGHLKSMGVKDLRRAEECVGKMSEAIARDDTYLAMHHGMQYIDLTGTYRLLAALLCAEPLEEVSCGTREPSYLDLVGED